MQRASSIVGSTVRFAVAAVAAVATACATQAALFRTGHIMYMHGPGMLGGWEGQADADICARLTSTASDVWFRNQNECRALIEKKVTAYVIGAVLICAAFLMYHAIATLWKYCWWRFAMRWSSVEAAIPKPHAEPPFILLDSRHYYGQSARFPAPLAVAQAPMYTTRSSL